MCSVTRICTAVEIATQENKGKCPSELYAIFVEVAQRDGDEINDFMKQFLQAHAKANGVCKCPAQQCL